MFRVIGVYGTVSLLGACSLFLKNMRNRMASFISEVGFEVFGILENSCQRFLFSRGCGGDVIHPLFSIINSRVRQFYDLPKTEE